jgi:hypothetical protein
MNDMNRSIRLRHIIYIVVAAVAMTLGSCRQSTTQLDNPDVEQFIKELKAGDYNCRNEFGITAIPNFKEADIPELLAHADDLTLIPSFPTMYSSTSGKIRLGECLLWIVETIRLGTPASMGCNMVEANADNYEAIYFLTDDQVMDAVQRYRYWWENRQYPRTIWTIDPCYDEPLCGSGYRWW